jgi:hypothetical protein
MSSDFLVVGAVECHCDGLESGARIQIEIQAEPFTFVIEVPEDQAPWLANAFAYGVARIAVTNGPLGT